MASAYPPTGSQPPSVELTVRQGPQPGQRFSLNKPAITIGREAGNDVMINDPQISRRHASLTWDGRQFIIQDLGSMNGTFVNGVRLAAPQVLQQGDVIGLGSTVLLGFQALPVAAAPPPAYAPPPPVVSPAAPPAYAPRPPARRRRRFLIPLAALLGLCFVLAVAAALGYYFLWPGPETRPLVLITSPRHGEQVEVGQEVTVQSIARDEGKVVRVELWVDGQLQESQTSNLPGGSSPFPLLTRWQPSSPGTHTLIARAFNARDGQGQASVNVEAIEVVDRDGDGVADEADACPDELGTEVADGCPDGDGDGIPDAEDACPDEPGLPENDGCPVPSEGDRDGDGILDEIDACPDEAGPPSADGCPDADGDGTRDSEDACPDEPGLPEQDGCLVPGDQDGDGVPDAEDDCPEEPGPGPSGCPDTGAGDRDGDGVPDADDACPEEPGPGPSGCPDTGPPPGTGDTDTDDSSGPFGNLVPWPPGGFFGTMEDVIIMNPVEFEALEFAVYHDYQELHCYAGLAGEYMERYDFEPLGERQWDIAAVLGGEDSRVVAVRADEPSLEVQAECWSSNIYTEPPPEESPPGGFPGGGGWGTVWDLGSFTELHPREDWDGHVIEQRSSGGSDGHAFWVSYRICRDSCSDVPFHPPQIELVEYAGSAYLAWLYYGDPTSIRGFGIYRNGAIVARRLSDEPATGGSGWTPAGATRYTYAFPSSWRPACGTLDEFHVTTYGNNVQESPRSNTVTWEGPPCPRTVRVQFMSLQTGHLGDDEWWADDVGPIFGNFWATGSSEERLGFSAVDYPEWAWGRIRGYRLGHNREYIIQDIFDWIGGWISGSMWSPYRGPEVNYVNVELGPDDDLTFGGSIWDADTGNPSDTLFEADFTVPADEVPGPGVVAARTIQDRNIELRVVIIGLGD